MTTEQTRKEDHRKRFARTLRVPENTDFAVSVYGIVCPFERTVDGKVLMVSGKYLGGSAFTMVKADEVMYDVQQTLFGEYTMEEGIVADMIFVFIDSVAALPLHIAFFVGCYRTGKGQSHVGNDVEGIVGEEIGRFELVVAYL